MVKNKQKIRFNWPVIGHEKILKILQKSIQNDTPSSAYLFIGHENIGKKTVAKLFINSFICFLSNSAKKEIELPCDNCSQCQQYKKGIHPDMVIIKKEDGKNIISIEQIREMQKRMLKKSFFPIYKITLIEGADNMNIEAANSLLKILEEPPTKTIFILTTDNIQSLPDTIKSRCQIVNFNPVNKDHIYDYLINQGAEKKNASIITKLAYGFPGKAINIFNQDEMIGNKKKLSAEFIKILRTKDNNIKLKYISSIIDRKVDIPDLFNDWSLIIRDIILLKKNKPELIVNNLLINDLQKISTRLQMNNLNKHLLKMNEYKNLIKNNVNQKLLLENFIINI